MNRRLLFVLTQLGQGGGQRQMLFLANAICTEGHEVHLAMYDTSGSYMPLLSPHCVVHRLRGPLGIGFPLRVFTLARLIARVDPDVIFTRLWGPAHLVYTTLKLSRHPARFVHGIGNTLDSYTLHRRAFNRVLRNRKIVLLVQTGRMVEKLRTYRRSCSNVYVVPNVVDVEMVARLARGRKKTSLQRPRAVVVGSLYPQKRHDRMLAVVRELKIRGVHMFVDVLGAGPLLPELIDLSRKLDLEGTVRFCGYKENPFPAMAQADLLLLTSDHEGMPNVVLEALVLGTPVVSTDVEYGPREIVEQGAGGYVVPRDDVSAFAGAVVKVLEDREMFSRRARENGVKFAIERYLPSYLQAMGLELEGKEGYSVVSGNWEWR